jgi:periplasmic divalent cation tolerance protein
MIILWRLKCVNADVAGFLFPKYHFNKGSAMSINNNYIIVLVTTANKVEAEKISQELLKEKLIACANIINPVNSFFYWSGKIDKAEECLVIMKSRMSLFGELAERLKGLHSYEVPEVLALPIVEGSKAYLSWMSEVLK